MGSNGRVFGGAGVGRVIECGTGKVLCGLNKRINKGLSCESLENIAGLTAALAIK